MKVLELFSGTESFSKIARARGHECFTIDIDLSFNPSLCKDILKVVPKDIPFQPDIIWASPPCTCFSVAGRKTNYINFMPTSVKSCLSLAYIYKTLEIIKELNPKFFIIENPMGYLRKFPCMNELKRIDVWYCQYGDSRAKPTDLWTNINFEGKKCKNDNPNCNHVRAPRGSKTGTQGRKDSVDRSRIPEELCLEIIKVCEKFG